MKVKVEKCWGAVDVSSCQVSGQGSEVGFMRWGEVPATEVVGDGVLATRDVFGA